MTKGPSGLEGPLGEVGCRGTDLGGFTAGVAGALSARAVSEALIREAGVLGGVLAALLTGLAWAEALAKDESKSNEAKMRRLIFSF